MIAFVLGLSPPQSARRETSRLTIVCFVFRFSLLEKGDQLFYCWRLTVSHELSDSYND